MTMDDNSNQKLPEWSNKPKEVTATYDVYEVAEILKDNVNNYRSDTEIIKHQEKEKQKQKQNTGLTEIEHPENTSTPTNTAHDKIFNRKNDIADANRNLAARYLKSSKSKLSRRGYRKLMVNADKDFVVRKKSDALGIARIGKDEINDLPASTLFKFDLRKVPSSRRRRWKSKRRQMLNLMEKSKKFRMNSKLFKGKGKKSVLTNFKLTGYTKKERLQIDRLRGITVKSPTKEKASKRGVSKDRFSIYMAKKKGRG